LLDAPDRDWAQHVESLIQKALGEWGSVTLGLPGERVGRINPILPLLAPISIARLDLLECLVQ